MRKMTKKRMTTMELCRRKSGSRQEGTVEETAVNTPLTVAGTIADIYPKTGQTMTGKAEVKDVPADHLTEKNATLTEEKEIMQTAGKDPEAKETARVVPPKEEALPKPLAETEPPAEIMLRMTEEAADTARAAAPGNEGMQEDGSRSRYADPEDHEEYDRFDEPENRDSYEDFEKLQQKRRRMDIENMADFDEQEEYGNYRNDPDLMNDEDLDELDEWKDN